MRSLRRLALLMGMVAFSGAAVQAAPRTAPETSTDPDAAYYRQARQALDRQDLAAARAIDFTRFRRGALREAGPRRSERDHTLEKILKDGLAKGDDGAALAAAREVLAQDAAHVRAYVIAFNVLSKQRHTVAAALHQAFSKGMVDSLLASGSGAAPTSAIVVYRVREEYDVARALELRVLQQAVRLVDGKLYDVLLVQNGGDRASSARARELFFDVSALQPHGGRR
jgi:hypothetical protein